MQKTDIEIARDTKLEHINNIANKLAIPESAVHCYGHHKAKIDYQFLDSLSGERNGKLILMTALSPTQQAKGKQPPQLGLVMH